MHGWDARMGCADEMRGWDARMGCLVKLLWGGHPAHPCLLHLNGNSYTQKTAKYFFFRREESRALTGEVQ
jgi:hypothetical protein